MYISVSYLCIVTLHLVTFEGVPEAMNAVRPQTIILFIASSLNVIHTFAGAWVVPVFMAIVFLP